jgi:hypothetical protein
MTAPRRSPTTRFLATALLLAGLAWSPPRAGAGAGAGADDGAGPTVLASVVLAGGFCGAAAANMPPCRMPDAPAAHVALVFVPEGAGAGSGAAGATTARVDGAGFLAASLKPGTYVVQLAQPGLALRLEATTVVVTAGQITQLALRIEALRP